MARFRHVPTNELRNGEERGSDPLLEEIADDARPDVDEDGVREEGALLAARPRERLDAEVAERVVDLVRARRLEPEPHLADAPGSGGRGSCTSASTRALPWTSSTRRSPLGSTLDELHALRARENAAVGLDVLEERRDLARPRRRPRVREAADVARRGAGLPGVLANHRLAAGEPSRLGRRSDDRRARPVRWRRALAQEARARRSA